MHCYCSLRVLRVFEVFVLLDNYNVPCCISTRERLNICWTILRRSLPSQRITDRLSSESFLESCFCKFKRESLDTVMYSSAEISKWHLLKQNHSYAFNYTTYRKPNATFTQTSLQDSYFQASALNMRRFVNDSSKSLRAKSVSAQERNAAPEENNRLHLTLILPPARDTSLGSL